MTSMIGNTGMRGPAGTSSGQTMTGGNIIPKGYKQGQLQQFTPEQIGLFQQLFSQVQPGSYLSRLAGGDQGAFEQLEAPALKQFGELQGDIASRFSGMGTGARRSSGFQNTLGQASSDFAQSLQAQRLGLQRQALQDLMGISSTLLGQRPYEQFLTEKPKSWWQELLGGLSEGAGSAAGTFGGLWGSKKLGLLG